MPGMVADYSDALQGMNVRMNNRIYDAVLNQVEVLDDNGYVQLITPWFRPP